MVEVITLPLSKLLNVTVIYITTLLPAGGNMYPLNMALDQSKPSGLGLQPGFLLPLAKVHRGIVPYNFA
jgi:hypothetical protein